MQHLLFSSFIYCVFVSQLIQCCYIVINRTMVYFMVICSNKLQLSVKLHEQP